MHDDGPPERAVPPRLLASIAALCLAGLGATLAGAGYPWIRALVAVALAGLTAAAGLLLWRARQDLADSRAALESRRAELATLHALGREILASLSPDRIAAVIERECRKMLGADHVRLLARDGKDEFSALGPSAEAAEPLPGLAPWVARERRSRRIADYHDLPPGSPLGAGRAPGMRSAMAVPLIVEDRVVGVLSLQHRAARAFDAAAVELLTTMAQHAAAAIENARHYRMATVDELTGCYLREYFFQRLDAEHERSLRYRGRFSVLMLDIDGFKTINDRHGHIAGDAYLRRVASIIREELRSADLAGRFGGDEFCMLLPETDAAGARTIAERIRVAVGAVVLRSEAGALRTTASIGVASYPEDGGAAGRDVLRHADQALYRAKRQGRDRVVPFAA